MRNTQDVLKARKAALEKELKQVNAAIKCFGGATTSKRQWTPEARAKLSASVKAAAQRRKAERSGSPQDAQPEANEAPRP